MSWPEQLEVGSGLQFPLLIVSSYQPSLGLLWEELQ